MNRCVVFLAAIILITVSCSREPKVIPIDQMRFVMWDMIRADELSNNNPADTSVALRNGRAVALYDTVFKIHHITKEEFYFSYDYYLRHPDLNKQLFDTIVKYGNKLVEEGHNAPRRPF